MIAVTRPAIAPEVLQEKQAEWTQSLCSARKAFYDAEATWAATPVADAKNAWYGHAEIRRVLEEEMFHHKCAYCEGRVRGHDHLEIEHFRPQSIYPALAYDWHNLLLACGICNGRSYKGDQFPLGASARLAEPNREQPCVLDDSDEAVLINPCLDDPAGFFIWRFEESPVGKEVTPLLLAREGNLRGSQTITICGLDRLSLTENHREKLGDVNIVLSLLHLASGMRQEEKRIEALTKLRALVAPEGVYSSMVRAYLAYRGFDFSLLTSA